MSLPSQEQKASYVQNMFGRIAEHYDLMNDLMTGGLHRFWKKRVCRLMQLQPGQKVLDLCCGTGDLTEMLAKDYPNSEVTGLDFSEEMLTVARKRSDKINFIRGDALNLPFENEQFDRISISFGLRNVSNYKLCLSEIYRVARKGAKLVILDLSHPKGFWNEVSKFFRFVIVPFMGKAIAGDSSAYEYLPNSIQIYPTQEELVKMLEEVGWQKVSYKNVFGGVVAFHEASKL